MIPPIEIGSRLHWEYYIALEENLLRSSRFVEFCEDNMSVHSTEFTILLLALGSEVDVIAKGFSRVLSPEKAPEGMKEYRHSILGAYPGFWKSEVAMPRFGLQIQPFITWEEDVVLRWWDSYNGVKHHRGERHKEGNLKNVVDATAGLFILLLYYYRQLYTASAALDPPSKLFSTGKYGSPDPNSRIWGYDLPDKYIYEPRPEAS